MYGRILLFRVEPYWDWNRWYDSSCLMDNPFYEFKKLREWDCHLCEDITQFKKLSDIKDELIVERYIRNEIPIIIGSDMMRADIEKWPIARHDFALSHIQNIYDENDWKNVCLFKTNLKVNDHLSLLNKLKSNQYSNIGWENCNSKTEKQLRKYYNRPQMIPPMLEMTMGNWILISYNYMIDPSPGTQVLLMIQIRGQNRIKAEAKHYCADKGCQQFEDILKENEILIISARLWNLSYIPIKANNSGIALIIGAKYN
ncbi:uncharacterized protein LOC128963597 [Oppia nitens]|uniref:uncharacterized protein LOC128963597 n=1 Tax=Oppia nitens TaxID=1686743 RepID=UPI0023DC48CF|nr:uncharacterized protein LOC128963597 [Oppia nitens]